MSKPTWDETFKELIDVFAKRSDDPNTKLGSIIVSPDHDVKSFGYNGLPRGVKPTMARLERPYKYNFMSHAENNAILNALRNKVDIKGCTIYIQMPPCVSCARDIIQAGLKEVVIGSTKSSNPKWEDDFRISKEMFKEAGVSWRKYL